MKGLHKIVSTKNKSPGVLVKNPVLGRFLAI